MTDELGRRALLGTAAAGLLLPPARAAGTIDPAEWTPDYVRRIAGTISVDTAAECDKVVKLNTRGRLTYWYVGPNEASPKLDHEIDARFWAAFAATYPNITVEKQSITYDTILQKVRTSAFGNAAPMVARMMLLWSPEMAAKGLLSAFRPEDVGHAAVFFLSPASKWITGTNLVMDGGLL